MSVLRRGPVLDWYVDGSESAVFVDGRVVALSELGTAILVAVGEDGRELDEVAAELEAAFGPPPDGSLLAAVEAATDALVQAGALRLDR